MAIIIRAFQDGDLTRVNGDKQHNPLCIRVAFTPERITEFMQHYKGNRITFDFKPMK